MGKKTVKWNKLKQKPGLPGQSSCSKCNSIGIIPSYDWICGQTYYFYCDCWFGQKQKMKNQTDDYGNSH